MHPLFLPLGGLDWQECWAQRVWLVWVKCLLLLESKVSPRWTKYSELYLLMEDEKYSSLASCTHQHYRQDEHASMAYQSQLF